MRREDAKEAKAAAKRNSAKKRLAFSFSIPLAFLRPFASALDLSNTGRESDGPDPVAMPGRIA
jgi:hypothetical protein